MKRLILLLAFVSFACSEKVQAQYSVASAFPYLQAFSLPLDIAHAGDGTNRLFIVQQRGLIYVIPNDPNVTSRRVFLDLRDMVSTSGNETGLLGLAFHPNYKNNGYFYVNYTNTVGGQLKSFVARYQVSSDPDSALKSSGTVLLTLNQPYANHNGGCIKFGLDGYLYTSFGDGGSGGDPQGNGQNRAVLLGKILRINVDSTDTTLAYAIPRDNPFYGNTSGFRQEIFAYGLRNVWRFSFDATGKLWAADVGQDAWEELDIITKGGNYGWKVMEGNHCYSPSTGCDTTGKIKPFWEYPHADGNVSVTGGYIYRGTATLGLTGKYIYADYGTGRIWGITYNGIAPATQVTLVERRTPTAMLVSSFGEDQNNELLFTSFGDGRIMKLVDSTSALLVTLGLSGNTYCAGSRIAVPFSVNTKNNPTPAAANVFTAQLSDVSGNFATPVTIGTLTGTTSGVIAATIPANTTLGSGYRIRVIASAPATTGLTSNTVLTITAPPVAVIESSGSPMTICEGDSVNLIANLVVNATYQWLMNNTPIPGAINFSYYARLAGSYAVAIATAGDCSDTSSAFIVNVTSLPKPVIQRLGNKLWITLPPGATAIWYGVNGNVVGSGDTLVVSLAGKYSVRVTLGPCSSLSDVLDMSSGVKDDALTSLGVSIYPNPTSGNINLHFANAVTEDVRVSISDVSGKLILESVIRRESVAGNRASISSSNLADGVYIVRLQMGSRVFVQAVTVMRGK